MARYSNFLGRRVEVHYRAGDILLPALGTFVADSGRSIFLEEHFQQRGQERHFRWEIPYQYIVRLEDKSEATPPQTSPVTQSSSSAASTAETISRSEPRNSAAAAAASSPLLAPNRPKTA